MGKQEIAALDIPLYEPVTQKPWAGFGSGGLKTLPSGTQKTDVLKPWK
jgi:hypothetical protein